MLTEMVHTVKINLGNIQCENTNNQFTFYYVFKLKIQVYSL